MTKQSIKIEPLKETELHIQLIGDSELMLHGRSRYYMLSEIWKQSHEEGAEPPAIYKQSKNTWEQLITSIHWKNPIQFHDEDISLYTEDEWKDYMENNQPCILPSAFCKSFVESFVTFFKPNIKKNGTDIKRAFNMIGNIYPITFSEAEIRQSIVPTQGGKSGGSSSVLASCNVFHGWKCEIGIACPDVVFPYATILSIVEATGRYIGIGSQRSNGFGRYHIENVQVVKNK